MKVIFAILLLVMLITHSHAKDERALQIEILTEKIFGYENVVVGKFSLNGKVHDNDLVAVLKGELDDRILGLIKDLECEAAILGRCFIYCCTIEEIDNGVRINKLIYYQGKNGKFYANLGDSDLYFDITDLTKK